MHPMDTPRNQDTSYRKNPVGDRKNPVGKSDLGCFHGDLELLVFAIFSPDEKYNL